MVGDGSDGAQEVWGRDGGAEGIIKGDTGGLEESRAATEGSPPQSHRKEIVHSWIN